MNGDATTGRIVETAPDKDGLRYCPECEAYLPLHQFYTDRRTQSGLTRRCRTHHSQHSYEARQHSERPHARRDYDRTIRLRLKYGMTPEDYEKLLKQQNDRCAICQRREKVALEDW